MEEDIGALKRELGRWERGRGKRYPAELKQRIARWVRQRRAEGATWPMVSEELGLGVSTLHRLRLFKQAAEKPTRTLVPVRVVTRSSAVAAASQISLSGWRVEGLTPAEAAELVRALQ